MVATPHFKPEEFTCSHCGKERMSQAFIDQLEKARVKAGIYFKITSGYRCAEKQAQLRKQGYETARGKSPHEKGVAADIAIFSDQLRWIIVKGLLDAGFQRIGFGSNFVHVDADEDRHALRLWHYKR